MDERKVIKVFWGGEEQPISLPPGVCLVIGNANLANITWERGMTQLKMGDLRGLSRAEVTAISSIYASNRTVALVGFYRLMTNSRMDPMIKVRQDLLDKCKSIANFELVIVSLPADTVGIEVTTRLPMTEDEPDNSVGYTGIARHFDEFRNRPHTDIFVKQAGDPLMYVRMPYEEGAFLILMGTTAEIVYHLGGNELTMEAINYRGPWTLDQKGKGKCCQGKLDLYFHIPWTQKSRTTIRRSQYSYFEDLDSSSESEEDAPQERPTKRFKAITLNDDPGVSGSGPSAPKKKKEEDTTDDEL